MIMIMMMEKKMGRMDSKGYEDVELHGWCIDFVAASMVHKYGVQYRIVHACSVELENKKVDVMEFGG